LFDAGQPVVAHSACALDKSKSRRSTRPRCRVCVFPASAAARRSSTRSAWSEIRWP
jgi:hypothetical protein